MDTTKTDKRADDESAKDAKNAKNAKNTAVEAGGEGLQDSKDSKDSKEERAPEGTEAAAGAKGEESRAEATAEDAEESDDLDDLAAEAPVRTSSGVGSGAAAVVGAALGLASLTGTWAGTVLAERQTLIGQIKVQSGQATDQIATVYGSPWHTHALVNGIFALLAVVVGGAVLARPRPTWVRAVAIGGLALGVLGVLISAGMYFDLFASLPKLPVRGS